MRSRMLAAVLVAGLVAIAGPAWSQGRGGGHSGGGGGHSGGGGHVGGGHVSGGHAGGGGHSAVGHRAPVGQIGGGAHGGAAGRWSGDRGRRGGRGDWGGHFGYRGVHGWPGFYLSFPLWWDAYYWWGWPYGWDGYYGDYGTDPDAGPWDGEGGSSGSGDATEEVAGPAPVATDVSPSSALVLLNGVLIGSADEFDDSPDYLYLEPGHYTLEFRLPGYRSKVVELSVGGEAKTIVSLELQVDPTAPVVAPAPSSPGLPYGRTFAPDFGPARAKVQPGVGAPVRQPLRQRSEADSRPPSTGSGHEVAALKLHVVPGNAAVYLDGVLLGTGDELGRLQQGIAVTPGPHRVEAVAPGRTGKTLQVEATVGKEQELTIELQ